MADLAITASQVKQDTTNAQVFNGTAAVSITAGQSVFVDTGTTPNTVKLADADDTVTTAGAKGIALNDAEVDHPVQVQEGGTITLGAGAAPTKGTIFVVSGTAGGIAPAADLASGDFVTILGVGNSTNGLEMDVFLSGVQV